MDLLNAIVFIIEKFSFSSKSSFEFLEKICKLLETQFLKSLRIKNRVEIVNFNTFDWYYKYSHDCVNVTLSLHTSDKTYIYTYKKSYTLDLCPTAAKSDVFDSGKGQATTSENRALLFTNSVWVSLTSHRYLQQGL